VVEKSETRKRGASRRHGALHARNGLAGEMRRVIMPHVGREG
jgi:hypothetical protein